MSNIEVLREIINEASQVSNGDVVRGKLETLARKADALTDPYRQQLLRNGDEINALRQRAEAAEAQLLAMVDAAEHERDKARAIQDAYIQDNERIAAERDALAQQLQQVQRELDAVPVSAIGYLMADIEPIDDGDTQRLHESRAAVLEWLDEEQEAANAEAEMRAPTYNGGCW